MPAKNQIKGKTEKQDSKEKKKKFSLQKFYQPFVRILENEKLHKITGLTLLLISACLLVAFTSFLFTWKADQSELFRPASDLFFNPELKVDNWLGKTGALVSHLFIHKWFGVASFLFILISFTSGLRLLKLAVLPLKKTVEYSIFTILWASITLAYIFRETELLYLGGGLGAFVNDWLISVLGNLGTGFFLVFILFTFLIISFNISFGWIKNAFYSFTESELKPAEAESGIEVNSDQDDEDVVPTLTEELNDVNSAEEVEENVIDLNDPTEDSDDTTPDANEGNDQELEIATPIEESSPRDKEEDEEGDLDLDVEEAQSDDITLSNKEIEKNQKDITSFDPTLDLSKYKFPTVELLEEYGSGGGIQVDREELEQNKNRIVETLANYNIGISKIKATIGPTITLYEIIPEKGVRISKIKNLEDDIALSLAALGIRIIAPIPGRGTIGIEVPNQKSEIVAMKTLLSSDKFHNTDMELPVAMGKTISNETFLTDLAKMPHLLMAGATGQGKSVGLNAILVSLLYKKHPSQVKFVLVDPKKVELTLFNKIERHFLAKLPDSEEAIITDTKKVVNTLNSLCVEMDARYDLLKQAQVRNIKEYNNKFIARKLNPEKGHKYMPYIVLVVDEFADLIMTAGKEVETPIARLAQLARAIGIHLIIATQRPSVNVITGTIKANFPARVAFRVTSKVDSRTILDAGGADQLVGRGDMLLSTGNDLIRLQCAFVDTPEVEKITEWIGEQQGYPDAFLLPEFQGDSETGNGEIDDSERDALFNDAAHVIVQNQQGSASLLQRRLKLGYNRAGRLIDQLEAAGIIGPHEGSKARQVLIPDEYALEQFLSNQENNQSDNS